MATLQIFIATYNRPDLICKTIDSILTQKGWDYELLVSDNSTNDLTSKIISEKYAKLVRYIKRNLSVDVITHLNMILSDVSADYFMIFHDDDTMNEGMLKSIHEAFKNDQSLVAVGCNAHTIKNDKIGKTWFLRDHKENQLVKGPRDMAGRYLVPNQIVPFPSYIFSAAVALNLRFDSGKGGKFSDVAFLIDVAALGNILLIAMPLMNYFIHKGQDSFTNDFKARLKLIKYISEKAGIEKSRRDLKKFRLNNIYLENRSSKLLRVRALLRKRSLILLAEKDYSAYIKLSLLTILSRFK